jgi:hypothetical protein
MRCNARNTTNALSPRDTVEKEVLKNVMISEVA